MAVLIAGPTASGKSALALEVARRLAGVVVNADAMQVYRDLKVLTARPAEADEAAVAHALYGYVDAAVPHSVAAWLDDAAATLARIRQDGRVPVITGGTGLYLAALTEGLSPVPRVPHDVRRAWRERQVRESAAALHAELALRDPRMAERLRPSDPQRVVRALEVIEGTGRSLADWQRARTPPVLPPGPQVRRLVIAPPRVALRAAISARFSRMLHEGAVEEAAALAARGLDPGLPAMKAIGVAPLAALAAGRLGRDEAAERAVTETRRYAKRQETWFRHRFADWPRAAGPEEGIAVIGAERG